MTRYLVWLPLLALTAIALSLVGVVVQGKDPSAIASPLTGDPAPALHVSAFGETGKFVTGDDLKGKPHLVNFFASWCGPCAAENKRLVEMADDHHIPILGIAMKDNPDTLQAYLDKRGNPYARIGFDAEGGTAIDWGVSGVPETFVINAAGRIIERHVGELDSDEEAHLIALMKNGA